MFGGGRGIVNTLVRGAVDATIAVAGKSVARFAAAKLPNFLGGNTGMVVNQAIVAAVLGAVSGRFLGGDRARVLVQGALQAPIEAAIAPVLASVGLSSYVQPRIASYVQPGALSAYVQPNGMRMLASDESASGMGVAY